SRGMRQPSRNSRGGRKSRKKISGSSVTRQSAISPITAPSAIWNSGRGSGSGTIRENMPLRMTASSSSRTMVMVSNSLPSIGADEGGGTGDAGRPSVRSALSHEFRAQHQPLDAFVAAVDLLGVSGQPDRLDHRAALQRLVRA